MSVTSSQPEWEAVRREQLAHDLVHAALSYARRGWRVFPCVPGGKQPVGGHGFLDATVDPDRIVRWWLNRPLANIGVATGAPGPDVLDVDVKVDGNGWAAFNRAKREGLTGGWHRAVRTRNGGLHLFFEGTDQSSRSLRTHRLDFKATGGYVIAAPSVVPPDAGVDGPGRYELIEDRDGTARCDFGEIRALLDPPRPMRPRPPVSTDPDKVRARLEGAARWMARQTEPGRNVALRDMARTLLLDGIDDLSLLAEAAHSTGLSAGEISRTLDSVRRYVLRGAS